MPMLKSLLLTALFLASSQSSAFCFDRASKTYNIHHSTLKGIARQESSFNPMAINVNADGSEDIGVMQINTGWLGKLATFGLTRQHLFDPCTNVMVGAWVLANNIRTHGNTWEAVGAYNVGCKKLSREECTKRRSRYVQNVQRQMAKLGYLF